MSLFRNILAGLIASAAVAAPPPAQGARGYENTDFGYKLKPPKDWTQIPMQSEEKWQTAKWMCNRQYFYTEPGGGWTYDHKPELVVIAFRSAAALKKAQVEKKEDKDTKSVVIIISNPYKDYLDYLKRTNTDGGFYVSDEKEVDLGDHKATCYEIKIEKLARSGPKRIITWVHHTPEVDFAVQMDVLENSWDKIKKEVLDTQKSFGLIERAGAGLTAGLGAAETGEKVDFVDESKLAPDKRKERRLSSEKVAHEKAAKTVTEGWQVLQIGRFMILNHADEKFARRLGEQAEAVFKWCETTFPFVGPEEYVRQPVIRICASQDEERSFFGGGTFFFFGSSMPEIVTHDDQEGFVTSYEVDFVNGALLSLWFQERDRDLWFAMPGWLGNGLHQLVQKSRVDKNKLVFRADDWGRDQLRELMRDGKTTKPRELFKLTDADYVGGDRDLWASRHYQSGALLRFLTIGAGAKGAKSKDVMRNYVKTLRTVITEIEKADAAAGPQADKKPKTEAEEEAYFKNKNQEWKKKEQTLLDQTFERCFHGWSDSDWDAFEKLYFDDI